RSTWERTADPLADVSCTCLESFALGAFEFEQVTTDRAHQVPIFTGQVCKAVESPCSDKCLRIFDIFQQDGFDAFQIFTCPVKKSNGADNLKTDFPLVAVRKRSDENVFMRIDPFRMIASDFFEEIERTLRDQPLLIVSQLDELGDEPWLLF